MRIRNIIVGGVLMLAVLLTALSAMAQIAGTIAGSVSSDRGTLKTARVKASDTERKIAYTVFTNGGRYQMHNLPPGAYQVTALYDGFESVPQEVTLKAGESKTADLALATKPPTSNVELVDFDTLYPPGPGRDIFIKECAGCHSFAHIPIHKRGPRDEEAWRRAVSRMFVPMQQRSIPTVDPNAVSEEQRETIVKYFAANFGPGSKPRDLKLDELQLDEAVLSQAMWVQYELPPPGKNARGEQVARRGTHDVWPSTVSTMVYAVDTSGSILGLDRSKLDYAERWKEWTIPSSTKFSTHPHGIVETNGKVYWTQLDASSVGELDPNTGEIKQYTTPTPSAPHTLRADSKGNVWYSSLYNVGKMGVLDAKTKEITEWVPDPKYKNTHYYGMTVDKQDRVWATAQTSHMIAGYDPKTRKWTSYPTPTQPSGPRRPTVAPDGMVWFTENIADAIGMLDPKTGKITEFKSPFRHAGEYEIFADRKGDLWVTLRAYEALSKFDPKTKKYTHYPHPVPKGGGRIPKVEEDSEGNIWGALGRTLIVLKPKGNVPKQANMSLAR